MVGEIRMPWIGTPKRPLWAMTSTAEKRMQKSGAFPYAAEKIIGKRLLFWFFEK